MPRELAKRMLFALPPKARIGLGRFLYERLRYGNGRLARRGRVLALRLQGGKIGASVKIGRNVSVDNPENLVVGDCVSIQESCFLSAYGGITIGSEVSIGRGTCIVSSSHPYEGEGPIRRNPLVKLPVTIGSDVWIGMNVSVLGGVRIDGRTVVAAMSLVNDDVPTGSVAGGIPAKKLKTF